MKALILCLLLAASAAAETPAPVAVFSVPEVKHAPSQKRVARALSWAAAELHLADRELPRVAVFYIDRQTAKTMQIDPSNEIVIVSATNHVDALRKVYQAWVVDGATDTATALAMIHVLNVRFNLGLDGTRIREVTQKVQSRMQQEIDVASLR